MLADKEAALAVELGEQRHNLLGSLVAVHVRGAGLALARVVASGGGSRRVGVVVGGRAEEQVQARHGMEQRHAHGVQDGRLQKGQQRGVQLAALGQNVHERVVAQLHRHQLHHGRRVQQALERHDAEHAGRVGRLLRRELVQQRPERLEQLLLLLVQL